MRDFKVLVVILVLLLVVYLFNCILSLILESINIYLLYFVKIDVNIFVVWKFKYYCVY